MRWLNVDSNIVLPHNWSVRPDQRPLWDYMQQNARGARAVEVAHRQYGKDTIIMHTIACLAHERIGNYWHMLPQSEQCNTAIWTAINPDTGISRIDEAFPNELRSSTNNTKMRIDFKCGSTYQLLGSDNYNSLVSSMPVFIGASEWALADPLAYAYLDPMIQKNNGAWMFVSTSRGRNHFKKLYDFAKTEKGWYAGMHKASETGVYTEEQLSKIKRSYKAAFGEEMGEALYLQEYECSFEGAIFGAYYSRQISEARASGRICRVPWQPSQEVYAYWDIGVNDANSIWFIQHIGQGHHVIDYHEATGMGMDYFARVLKEKGYNYAENVMPHDGEARKMTGGQLSKSPKELAEDTGIRPVRIVPRAQNMDIIVMSEIPTVRNILSQCWFDDVKCARGISGLEGYHAKYNEETKTMSNRPAHTWESNPADAFRTFAVGYAPKRPPDESVTDMMRRFRG